MTITRRDFSCGLASSALLAGPLGSYTASAQASRTPKMLELQQRFVDLRFGMFLHFNMATFQDREWGDPTSSPQLFHPTALDTDQWASVAKQARMTWGCITTRHHDGFCIWPTKTSGASVSQGVNVDVVSSYVNSFRRAGLRVGLYYSILSLRDDIRHFNVTPQKIALIKAQLTELFSNYGAIDILITDGWDAPWSRITYDEVPFREIYDHIKAMQPDCLICDLNAASYPAEGLYYSDVKAFEQNAGQHVPKESDLPALSCVTITEGWFWKQSDAHGQLKSATTVVNDWLLPLNRRHCNLILNAPPTREGRLAPNVVDRLIEIGKLWIPEPFAGRVQPSVIISTANLAKGKPIHASSSPDTIGPDLANDGSFSSSWVPEEGDKEPWLEVDLLKEQRVSVVSLIRGRSAEATPAAQRCVWQHWAGTSWQDIIDSPGLKAVEIIRVKPVLSQRFRIRFLAKSANLSVTDIGLYDEP